MSEEVSVLFEIMQTTRSMRRLKPDPVPAALIRKVLEAGTSAPSGGNMQRWRFLVVRDPEIKKTIGAYYKRAWDEVVSPRYRAGEPAPGTSGERFSRMARCGPISRRSYPRSSGLDHSVHAGSKHDPAGWFFDLSGGSEHVAGRDSARPWGYADNAVSQLRERGRNCSRLAFRCAFLCSDYGWVSIGSVRAGS